MSKTKHQENFGPTLEALLLHKEWLRRLARGLVFDASQADDVVQQVFLSALKYRPSTDRDIRPWLKVVAMAVAKKIGRSEVRRTRREKATAKEDVLPLEERIAQLETGDTYRQLGEFLKNLEEPYRTILFMHYFEGIPIDEVGKRLKLSRSTVRNRYKRGIELLRARLDSRYGDRTAWGLALLPEIPLFAPSIAASDAAVTTAKSAGKKGFWGVAAGVLLIPATAILMGSLLAIPGEGVSTSQSAESESRVAVDDFPNSGTRTPISEEEISPVPQDAAGVAAQGTSKNSSAAEPATLSPGRGGPRAVNFQTGESIPAKMIVGEPQQDSSDATPTIVEPASSQGSESTPSATSKQPRAVRKNGVSIQKPN